MGYEIDILGVGDKSNSGDAIAIRYGNLFGSRDEQKVIVIDGGFKGDGNKLVSHIQSYYDTDMVDLVISTHPDQDHINGLEAVLENLDVSELWIHKAWEHNQGLADRFHDGRITDNSIGERLKASLEQAHDLAKLAERKGIKVTEPFASLTFDAATVLGPREDYYEELLSQFEGMPDVKPPSELRDAATLLEALHGKLGKAWKTIRAAWGEDKIDDEDTTSAKNNSSVVTQLCVDGRMLLFTGDAGIMALEQAADSLSTGGECKFIQIPHHGSRCNVGPSVLNRLIGRPVSQGEIRNITAIVSSAKDGEPKHPHKVVLNAFTHRGLKVLVTRGVGICSSYNAPERQGWCSLEPERYHYEYEDEV